MKNNKNLVPYRVQDGVTLYFESQLMNDVLDIDIDPGIKKVRLSGPLPNTRRAERCITLRSIKKQFPDVTELCIGEDIYDIDVSNFMFPNVRYVDSESPNFSRGQYLISTYCGNTLKNVFCINEEESVTSISADTIDDYAFEGCLKINGFFDFDDSSISVFPIHIHHHAFDNSGFLNLPSHDGLKHDGPVIFDVDDKAKEVVFHSRNRYEYIMPDDFGWKNVTTAIVEDIYDMSCITNLPATVVVMKASCDINLWLNYMNDANVACYKTSDDSDFTAIDGILYSKDKKHLLRCPGGRDGNIVVPDGTEFINDSAFYKSNICSVSFPSTLKAIGEKAFRFSKLSKIDFGSGIRTLGEGAGYAFSDCYNLEEIEIPAQVTTIGKAAFLNCNKLKKIILHEGLSTICEGAFKLCPWLGYVEVPSTVTYLGSECFSHVQILKIPKLVSGVLYAISSFGGEQATFFHVKKIITDTNEYILPSEIKAKALYELMSDCENNYLPDDMYNYADNTVAKQDTIYYVNLTCPDKRDETGKYIKRYAKKMALRYLDINEAEAEKLVIGLIQGNFLSKAALKELLDTVNKKDKASIAAYILEKLNRTKKHSLNL